MFISNAIEFIVLELQTGIYSGSRFEVTLKAP